eukprot:403364396
MKVSNVRQMARLDPEDIRDSSGDKEREIKRKKFLRSFLWWASGEKQRWNATNNDERIIVKRQFAYGRMLVMFGLFTNFAVYNCFFTGIYNFRQSELVAMRRVPFLLKFSLSSAMAFYMCNKLWDNNIYEAELYEVALRYRDRFDKQYRPQIQPTQQSSSTENTNEESSQNKNLQIA